MTQASFPQSINYSQALKLVQQVAQTHQLKTEQVEVRNACNRVLSATVLSPLNVPEFDSSQVDGYAINADYFRAHKIKSLPLNKAIHAGDGGTEEDCTQFATPIMTGAILPGTCNAVVMKEHVSINGASLQVEQFVTKLQHVRKAGTDIKRGQLVLKSNHALAARDLGLLSSIGLTHVEVYQQPRVALIMTGDELLQAGETSKKGQVYDANSLMLKTMLIKLGCEVNFLGTLADDKSSVQACFNQLKNESYDLILSVGGVSMGDKDYLPEILQAQGAIVFHKCRIKPGFPLLFGHLGGALYFGLPGNPVSAFSCLFQFVYPAVLSVLQMNRTSPLSWHAELLQDVAKTHMRREFLRGRYNMTAKGTLEVVVCGSQQSSRIQSLSEANCLIVLDESQQDLKRNDSVIIQPFNQLNCLHE